MKRGRRAWLVNGVLVVVLVAAGWGGYQLLWPHSSSTTPTNVRTVAASRTSVVQTVSAAGSVQSSYSGSADFSTSGTISEIDVKVGDVVTAGQVLAKLDATQANEQLTVAKDNLLVAQQNQANGGATTTGTGKSATTSTQSAAQLQTAVDQAQLAVDQAQDTVNATVLTAPAAGTVTAVNGSVGQKAGSGSASSSSSSSSSKSGGAASSGSGTSGFITLTNMTSLQVKAQVAEIDVSKTKVGQDATVTVNALPDTPVAAKVAAVDLTPTTTNGVVQYGVTLNLTSPPAGLLPGQSASIAITVAQADNALAIPSAALQSGSNGSHTVTVLANGQQTTKPVQIGVRSESLVQITSGLSEGDQVVLSTASIATGTQGGQGRGGFTGGGFTGAGGNQVTRVGGGGK